MTTTASETSGTATVPDTAAGVLAAARERRAAADRAEADLLGLAVQWAMIHPAETLDDAEGYATRVHLAGVDEQPVTLAGPGAPLVREFSVAEFAAAIGVGTETGKHYLGHALELRYRLPRLWARVVAGDLAAWKPGWSPGRPSAPPSPSRPPGSSTGTSRRWPTRSARSS